MSMADAEAPFLLPADDDEAAPLAGVSDFRGRPVLRAGSGGWRSALFVCGNDGGCQFLLINWASFVRTTMECCKQMSTNIYKSQQMEMNC
ncbi:hypothetical protein VPH35_033275 [Triticum aestivum]